MVPRARLTVTIVVALAAIFVAGPARGQLDLSAAVDTVLAQLEAFRRDDYDTAYTFASKTIRQMFDRRGFERMVKTGYPEIARSRSAIIESAAVTSDGRAYLILKIRGANGNRIEAIYEMVWESDRWKIGGVVSRPDNEVV
jgi:hypothetical protein